MGCDGLARRRARRPGYFNPRIPYGMRLAAHVDLRSVAVISIHASRMGCDNVGSEISVEREAISIHASRMGCDQRLHGDEQEHSISIHASRMGCDSAVKCGVSRSVDDFNPRIPYGMRLVA